MVASRLGIQPHAIQKHGFSDSTQAHYEDALACPADPDALDRDPDVFTDFIPASQFGRLGACSGSIGVSNRIHADFYQNYPSLQEFNKLG
jgi:hypothetical protein